MWNLFVVYIVVVSGPKIWLVFYAVLKDFCLIEKLTILVGSIFCPLSFLDQLNFFLHDVRKLEVSNSHTPLKCASGYALNYIPLPAMVRLHVRQICFHLVLHFPYLRHFPKILPFNKL